MQDNGCDDQQARNDTLLRDIRALESTWKLWYQRRIKMSEREAYLWGRIDGLRSIVEARGGHDVG